MKFKRLAAAAGLLVAVSATGLTTAGSAVADPYPAGNQSSAQINSSVFAPGSQVVVTVLNVTPGTLTMEILSAPAVIGGGTQFANANGTGSTGTATGTIPLGYVGPHTIQVTSAGGDVFQFAITVTSSSSGVGAGGVGAGGSGGSGAGSSGSAGDLASTGAAVTGIGILGGILVAGGVFFVVAGRRRTANGATPTV